MKVEVEPEDTIPFIEESVIKGSGEVADFLKKDSQR